MDRKPKLPDPYEKLPAKDKTVTSLTVSDLDRAYLFSIYPQQSVLQTTANCLLAEFVKAMRKAGYKHYAPLDYVKALNSIKITVDEPKPKEEKKIV